MELRAIRGVGIHMRKSCTHNPVSGYQSTSGSGALGSYGRPTSCARASRSGYNSPPGREVDGHTDKDADSCLPVLQPRIPGNRRSSYSRYYGRSQTPCTVAPLARQPAGEPQTCRLLSITEHSFLLKKGKSVTHESGTICYLCVRSLRFILPKT